MTVIANTSPLMNLAVVSHLEVLGRLYGQVLIPTAVRQELVALTQHHPELEHG